MVSEGELVGSKSPARTTKTTIAKAKATVIVDLKKVFSFCMVKKLSIYKKTEE
jgi:hypothetical protein